MPSEARCSVVMAFRIRAISTRCPWWWRCRAFSWAATRNASSGKVRGRPTPVSSNGESTGTTPDFSITCRATCRSVSPVARPPPVPIGGRLLDPDEDDAVPAGDVFRCDPSRPAPVQPRTGTKGDERLTGPEAGRRGLVLSIPPEQLQLIRRIRSGHPPPVDRLSPGLPRRLGGQQGTEPPERGPVGAPAPIVPDADR